MGIYFFDLDSAISDRIKKEVDIFYGEIYKIFGIDLEIEIFFYTSRKKFDKEFGNKTEKWIVGFSNKNRVHLISPEFINKLSIHKMKEEWYIRLAKHEIVHCFYNHYKHRNDKFNEAVAMWLSRNFLIKEVKKIKIKNINEILDFPQDYKNASILALFLFYLEREGFDRKELLLNLSKEIISEKYSYRWKDFLKFRKIFHSS